MQISNDNKDKIIDGKAFADRLCEEITKKVIILQDKYDIIPGLAVVIVGQDPASQIYVRNKIARTKQVGMNSFDYRLPDNISQEDLLSTIEWLNQDAQVNGILVQLPLPSHIDANAVIDAIKPEKDVDGFTTINVGRLGVGSSKAFIPCTPKGCMMLLTDKLGQDFSGIKAVVIGRSNIVGKPIANLLMQKNATVTVVHSKTKDIHDEIRRADIVIAALGSAEFVKAEFIKDNAIIIDVGINRVTQADGSSKIVGDVDFQDVIDKVRYITPVPGGVGPMTIACLLENTLESCVRAHKLQI